MAPFLLLDDFIQFLETEKRFSEHTCLAYKRDISQFLEFSEVKSTQDIGEINSKLGRAWIVSMLEEDYSSSSVNRKLSSLRSFFTWMVKKSILDTNPIKGVVGPKNKKRLPSFAQSKELETDCIDLFFKNDFDGIRDRLMFEVFYQTGVRSSELINLRDKNVQDSRIKVLGKRNKERFIPISTKLFAFVTEYRRVRDEITQKSEYFFVLKSGKKLYPKFVYRKINSYLGKATELEKKSPHVLRHTFATHMLNNGAGLEVLKELLGHASLSATQIYTHNSFSQLTNIYSQSHPRGHKK
jgi:integrase/recombinase XerC